VRIQPRERQPHLGRARELAEVAVAPVVGVEVEAEGVENYQKKSLKNCENKLLYVFLKNCENKLLNFFMFFLIFRN
jgi:hypothetical protein